MKRKEKIKGFTLIELVVVMVIVGILAVISVPMYRNYVQRARAQEGTALVGAIASAQRAYYAGYGVYLAVALNTGHSTTLGIDASMNQYFQTFTVALGAVDEYIATTVGTGDATNVQVVLTQTAAGGPTVVVSGGGAD